MNDKDKLYIQAFERMLAEQQRLDANVKLIHKAIYAIFGVVLALLITLIPGIIECNALSYAFD